MKCKSTINFEKFTIKFKTLESLSKANETQILKMWEGLGYYRRARNLLASAKLLGLAAV